MNNDSILIEIVNKTLDELYKKELYIFENNVSERNMVFHFARYLIELLDGTEYERLSVDCEYNKNALDEKGYKEIIYNYDHIYHKIYPDLLLHKRGTNNQNVLAIEFKKYNNYNTKAIKSDKLKLKALTDKCAEFKYELGLFISFGRTRYDVEIRAFKNGTEIELYNI